MIGCPGAALEDSLVPGWYVRPFQGTELRFEGQNRDQRSSFNTFSTGEIRMLGGSLARRTLPVWLGPPEKERRRLKTTATR
jgi:hypothetical protein